ncbi:MAG: hypothetical protein IJ736_04495 [Firmicutes bacterium]|nr:hypothetical protein [Bacillota bacterium]
MIVIRNIKIPVDSKASRLEDQIIKRLRLKQLPQYKILKRSIDARKKPDIFYIYQVGIFLENENEENKIIKKINDNNIMLTKEVRYQFIDDHLKVNPGLNNTMLHHPLIIGAGPAGLFCAYVLAKCGYAPVIAERGLMVEDRINKVNDFWNGKGLDPECNVQFGEGGAGTFSDGKLTTGIKDKSCRFILEEFVKFGAPEEILYSAKPHIGTDKLIGVVKRIREEIIALGGEIRFENQLIDIKENKGKIKTAVIKNSKGIYEEAVNYLILALGHSARDTFEMLADKPIMIEQKPFAVGVRIEHKQEMINKAQYGKAAEYLAAADYKLWTHLADGRGVYTFCMCPGGVVSAAASEEGMVVTNGMSYYARDGENSNAALLVGVDSKDFGTEDVFGGIEFQRKLERAAFDVGGRNYFAPVQSVGDILIDRESRELGDVVPTYRPGVTPCDMRDIFPEEIYQSIKRGIIEFDKKLKGFADKNAVLTAIESRSSSPIRIVRDERLYSAIDGVMPCGEGCGYAGGIMSAAADGIRCAERIIGECDDQWS